MVVLRKRSGEGPEPTAAGEAALTEMGQVVAEARVEIARLVQMGALQDDPIRYPIQALSVHLEALYKVTLTGSQTLAKQIQASVQSDDLAKPSVPDDDLRRAHVHGLPARAAGIVAVPGTRNTLIGAGMLAAALLAGAAGGYWFRGAAPVVAGAHAGAVRCDDRPDGSRLCWIPVWERLPSAPASR